MTHPLFTSIFEDMAAIHRMSAEISKPKPTVEELEEKIKVLEAKLAQAERESEIHWKDCCRAEGILEEVSKLPQKWREQTYWENGVEEVCMDIENIFEEGLEQCRKN